MRIDIIEVETKRNKIKIVVIFLIILVLIALFSMLGIYLAKRYQSNYMKKHKENINISKNEQINKKEEKKNNNSDKANIDTKKLNNIFNKDTKIAYLTFDDGPTQAVTPLILDVLKKEQVKATFFVLGTNVRKNPDLVKRAYLEGHYIANHGYSHNYSKIYKSSNAVLEEYSKTEKIIRDAIGNKEYSSNLFRFPGGFTGGKYEKIKKEAGRLLNNKNISYIDWNVLTGDSEGANTKEKILENVKKHTKDKGNIVVLMHDSSSKILTYETLKDVIKYLRQQGYTFENFYSIMQ